MIAEQVIGFCINVFVFSLFNYFLELYLTSRTIHITKVCGIIVASVFLSMVNYLGVAAFNVVATFLLLLVYSLLLFSAEPIKKIVFSIVSVAMTSLAELLCTFIIAFFTSSSAQQTMSDELTYSLTGLVGCLVLRGIIGIVHKTCPMIKDGEYSWNILVLSLFPAVAVANMLVIFYFEEQIQPTRLGHLLAIFSSLLFVCLSIIVFFLYNNSLLNKDLERKVQLNEQIHASNELLFKQQKKEMESLQRLKHEFKSHLQTLYDFSQNGLIEKIQYYCQEELGIIRKEEKALYLLDFNNFTLSNVYARFIKECEKQSINYDSDISFRNFSFIKDIDASVLFNNLFSNALEACDSLAKEKWIKLEIYKAYGNIIIKLTNSVCFKIEKSDERFLSRKRNYLEPGVGIAQMVSISELYGGYTTCTYSDSYFETIIRFPFIQNAL